MPDPPFALFPRKTFACRAQPAFKTGFPGGCILFLRIVWWCKYRPPIKFDPNPFCGYQPPTLCTKVGEHLSVAFGLIAEALHSASATSAGLAYFMGDPLLARLLERFVFCAVTVL